MGKGGEPKGKGKDKGKVGKDMGKGKPERHQTQGKGKPQQPQIRNEFSRDMEEEGMAVHVAWPITVSAYPAGAWADLKGKVESSGCRLKLRGRATPNSAVSFERKRAEKRKNVLCIKGPEAYQVYKTFFEESQRVWGIDLSSVPPPQVLDVQAGEPDQELQPPQNETTFDEVDMHDDDNYEQEQFDRDRSKSRNFTVLFWFLVSSLLPFENQESKTQVFFIALHCIVLILHFTNIVVHAVLSVVICFVNCYWLLRL